MSINRFRQLMAAAAGGNELAVSAIIFNGSTHYMTRGADFTSNADSKVGTFSFWVRFTGSDTNQNNLWDCTGNFVYIYRETSAGGNQIRIQGDNAGGGRILDLETGTAITASDGWVHVLASWDLANNKAHLYINDVSDDDGSTTKTNDTINYTNANHSIGASVGGSTLLAGYLSEFYFNNEAYVDITVEANRRKFISATGKPVDLGANGELPTGSTPRVYLSVREGDAASVFTTNKGDGGNFTFNGGSASLAPNSPSD